MPTCTPSACRLTCLTHPPSAYPRLTHPALCSYKWDSLPNSQRPEKGLLRLRSSLNAFANLRPAVVLPQLADASTLKREVGCVWAMAAAAHCC